MQAKLVMSGKADMS